MTGVYSQRFIENYGVVSVLFTESCVLHGHIEDNFGFFRFFGFFRVIRLFRVDWFVGLVRFVGFVDFRRFFRFFRNGLFTSACYNCRRYGDNGNQRDAD